MVDQSEDLISVAVPDVSLQQSPPSYADSEPGLHKAGEQHEGHPMPERNRHAGVHSNPTVLVNISQAQSLLTRVITLLYRPYWSTAVGLQVLVN